MGSVIKISKHFKRNAILAILSILLFILTYFFLLLGTGYLFYQSIKLIYNYIIVAGNLSYLTIFFSVLVIIIISLLLFFLIKFIFRKNTTDKSNLIQISREEQPVLFSFIDEIVKEVGTDFPKKIYLSSDVNACVFYDSSFWSMFMPIKKNLEIGIGLINTVSEKELKAILSHEFGHFSQRSMKIGSYVYNVNQIIYNMLYENNSYSNMVVTLFNVSTYAAQTIVFIVNFIQWILRRLYKLINLNHLKLSREMEFHADEVAANITGYLPLKTSLMRMSLADYAFDSAISFY